jgi:hypothetical protein
MRSFKIFGPKAEHCNGAPRIFSQRFLRFVYQDFHLIFFRSHSSNPWKNREISKHLN